MLDILSLIPGKKRHTLSGWHSFNAVCCHHRGHQPDRRGRAGILVDHDGTWMHSCFNCGFKCGVALGKNFSTNTKQFLKWLGLDDLQINRLSFESYCERPEAGSSPLVKPVIINFDKKSLPEDSEILNADELNHAKYVEYLNSRAISLTDYKFYVTPQSRNFRDRDRIIVPYYYNSELVGYTSRYLDNRAPKYISEQQRGYVFNYDFQFRQSSVVLLVEGQFDAMSIDGCAYLGSTILNEQAKLITKLRREVIVVPDRDFTGMKICDRALELGYKVSIPDWHDGIKDANDAVIKYGKLPTIMSILQAATSSKITIEMKRKIFK